MGSIKDITLLHNYNVRITINVESSLAPLHQGTTAEIRVPSLSSVANRYIALSPGPNNNPSLPSGSTLPTTATHGVVDLDQLFGIFNAKTRKGLQQLIRGSAEQYSGVAPQLQIDAHYFPPALSAFDHVVSELGSDQSSLLKLPGRKRQGDHRAGRAQLRAHRTGQPCRYRLRGARLRTGPTWPPV